MILHAGARFGLGLVRGCLCLLRLSLAWETFETSPVGLVQSWRPQAAAACGLGALSPAGFGACALLDGAELTQFEVEGLGVMLTHRFVMSHLLNLLLRLLLGGEV